MYLKLAVSAMSLDNFGYVSEVAEKKLFYSEGSNSKAEKNTQKLTKHCSKADWKGFSLEDIKVAGTRKYRHEMSAPEATVSTRLLFFSQRAAVDNDMKERLKETNLVVEEICFFI